MNTPIDRRMEAALEICTEAGSVAMRYFEQLGSLRVEQKGPQDVVSQADKDVERFIRARIKELFPDDGVVGEEQPASIGSSDYRWVIDPIDGTANFVVGTPIWCTVLACVYKSTTVIGIIFDPNQNEIFAASKGSGAFLNGKRITVSQARDFTEGLLGFGISNRNPTSSVTAMIGAIARRDGAFSRTGSGALCMAYASCGRYIGFVEFFMYAWDCFAGLLLIEEAGGIVEPVDTEKFLVEGGRVIAGAPDIYEDLVKMTDSSMARSGALSDSAETAGRISQTGD